MSDRAQRIEVLCLAAERLPTGEREAFVRSECGADSVLATAALAALAERTPGSARKVERIGPYRILGVLGEGGMGTVYAAEQTEPVRRRVALKVIRHAMAKKEVLGRFELERQALAMMNHPNIAKVLDAGADNDGNPYFAMELVKGEPLVEYCDRNKLAIADRLRLFVQVCHGVQHAHHKGVIHRDLKPGNVLVEILDDKPIARIIDFGLARATNNALLQQTLFTEVGQVIGTPEYMSPEQAEMTGTDVDTRSDVYSLGVTLYELLTGTLPFSGAELRQAGLLEIQRRIREVEPPTPSRRVSSIHGESAMHADRRRLTSVALVRHLRHDLDWIVMRCLEKDRARRYQTAVELAADIERHLAGEPVLAGPPSVTYRLRKLVRRYRVAVGVLAGVFVVMAVALVLVVDAKRDAESRRAEVEQANAQLEELTGLLQAQYRVARVAELIRQGQSFLPLTPDRMAEASEWLKEARAFAAEASGLSQSAPTRERREKEQAEAGARLPPLLAQLDSQTAADGPLAARLSMLRSAAARAQPLWQQVRARVAQKSAVAITPQDLLMPLGPDPESGLEEFAVLQTGAVPVRDAGGRLVMTEDSAIVLVLLLPSGPFAMAPADDELEAKPVEKGDARPALDPFFIGKHEITQGQWFRMTGERPSRYRKDTQGPRAPPIDDRHPVEQVSWLQADAALQLFGLRLPTEAQWVFAARADAPVRTRWWTGNEMASLGDPTPAENLADEATVRVQADYRAVSEWGDLKYDDGYVYHSPVGSFRANGFGLHDLLGNVREHCRDLMDPQQGLLAPRPGDGLQGPPDRGLRALRGSSFSSGVVDARIAQRRAVPQAGGYDNVGLRAARALDR